MAQPCFGVGSTSNGSLSESHFAMPQHGKQPSPFSKFLLLIEFQVLYLDLILHIRPRGT